MEKYYGQLDFSCLRAKVTPHQANGKGPEDGSLVDDAYRRLISVQNRPLRASGPEKFSDSEVITVSLILETFFQGHEEVGYAFVSISAQSSIIPAVLPPILPVPMRRL